MASHPGALYEFPWPENALKYTLFLPFAAVVALGLDDADNWCWHILVIAALRYIHAQLWTSASRFHAISAGSRISARPIDFKQVDREEHWDNYIILQTLIMTAVHKLPYLQFGSFPLVNYVRRLPSRRVLAYWAAVYERV